MIYQKHSPDGEERGGADATNSLAPLVMQVVIRTEIVVLQGSVL
jgi:hypothetical protein